MKTVIETIILSLNPFFSKSEKVRYFGADTCNRVVYSYLPKAHFKVILCLSLLFLCHALLDNDVDDNI